MDLFSSRQQEFERRHIGPDEAETAEMLKTVGVDSMETLIEKALPAAIRLTRPLQLPPAQDEFRYLEALKSLAARNKVGKSFIGQGYYDTITPSVILRNVFENPGWYTQYTPYQAEISQGRLECLLNFQTVVSDLTALPVANASLLDEGTAAAEAMHLLFAHKNKGEAHPPAPRFFVDEKVFGQTRDVLETRSQPLGITLVYGDYRTASLDGSFFGALLQYPDSEGEVRDYRDFIRQAHEADAAVVMACDLLSLTLLTPPGELDADIAVGSAQRFGVPMGFGGPHAAFFAAKDEFKRLIPGRIIGVSVDNEGNHALRMALQTREQHIRREKATSNICTAQALLANMAALYAVYHGPEGLKRIAQRIHLLCILLGKQLQKAGFPPVTGNCFDTLKIAVKDEAALREKAGALAINLRYYGDGHVGISLDETTTPEDVNLLLQLFGAGELQLPEGNGAPQSGGIPRALQRSSSYLQHPVFNTHHSETEMMRYLKYLEQKDLSLNTAMIPLGSCTMKLNAATQLIPVSWPEFSRIHPFAPADQTAGYRLLLTQLEDMLAELTGLAACSLQPNSGAQGEYAGLMVIRAYHRGRGESHRNVVLIPVSAHGTNPASAVMAGMRVVVVQCDEQGNIDIADLREKAAAHQDDLAALMVTYPSTHGVFEEGIRDICSIIHKHGGQVYMDGANMNAQVGLTSPGLIGADVCHLNLHKTFAIPHGGGGPGMGPICAAAHLAPYLPGHRMGNTGGEKAIHAVSSAPFGSASILLVSYAYLRLLGASGLRKASEYAILNANYMKARLDGHYRILYSGRNGTCAHEFIIDLRPFKSAGIEAEDVAKRLMDYGFHAPTLSFPVAGTLMVEPTESEDKAELDRFCEAMIAIRGEITAVAEGHADKKDNVLKNAPHTQLAVCSSGWSHPYTREQAAFPLDYLRRQKFWPSTGRINNTYGDRNLICTCEPVAAYA
ncbi:aminomethyl-transferring glycine dehydrogenase [Compostibacter hankyongensis]|uniref:Glycine dehydrogenase (decarboxylating) n=1 Tax=Compostibacter hankyongensis TaxID=1007089 RepID=A0ABP8G729_9BACT